MREKVSVYEYLIIIVEIRMYNEKQDINHHRRLAFSLKSLVECV